MLILFNLIDWIHRRKLAVFLFLLITFAVVNFLNFKVVRAQSIVNLGTVEKTSHIYVEKTMGIGTTNPSYPFSILGTAADYANNTITGSFFSIGASGGNGLFFRSRANSNGIGGTLSAHQLISNNGGAFELYSINAVPLVFGTTATERMRIDASGNVGIGTTGPSYKLSVAGTATTGVETVANFHNPITATAALGNGPAISLGRSDGSYSTKIATIYEGNNPSWLQPSLAFYTMRDTYLPGSEVERMRISSTGNVGIGTTAPGTVAEAYRFETVNRQSYSDILTISAGANTMPWTGHGGGILFRATNYDSGTALVNSSRIGSTITNNSSTHTGAGLFFDTTPLDDGVLVRAVTILPSGSVGVGVTNPTYNLDVNAGLRAQNLNVKGLIDTAAGPVWVTAAGDLYRGVSGPAMENYWVLNGNNLAASTTAWNVGIGATNPLYKLDVTGDIRSTDRLIVGDYSIRVTNSGEAWLFRASDRAAGTLTVQLGGASAASTKFEIVDRDWIEVISSISGEAPGGSLVVQPTGNVTMMGGNVGIGTTNPQAKLDVNGNARFRSIGTTASTTVLGVTSDGTLTTNITVTGLELSADPANPTEGSYVTWMSNGTGSGDDGDIMMKITAGGVTKIITLVDFSTH